MKYRFWNEKDQSLKKNRVLEEIDQESNLDLNDIVFTMLDAYFKKHFENLILENQDHTLRKYAEIQQYIWLGQ